MRILIVTPDYPPPPGGIQTFTENLEKGLDSLGHDTKVLHLEPGDSKFPRDWIPRIMVSNPREFTKWPFFNRVYRDVRDKISKFSPSVVHTTHLVCWPALQAAKEMDVARTVSTHALELQNTYLAKSAASRTQNFHAVSHFTAGLTSSVTDINQEKIDVIPPSISVPSSVPELTPSGPVFCMSRLVKRKNVVSIIDAWKQLPQEIREKHGLIIAGDGDQRSSIESKASEDETIEVLGRISNKNKEKLLKEASVFSLTPLQNGFDVEGFGIVYLEAQAYGTPVIGSSKGGVPEAVGDAGILVDSPRDPEEIAEAIKKMLTDKTTRENCYQAINERIQQYGVIPVAQDHVSQYQELI